MNDNGGHIDFEQWAALAASDPEAFEAQRAQVIDAAIRRAPRPKQQRLRGLQWKLDHVRQLSGTPMAACLRMSNMMWDSVLKEGGLLDAFQSLGHARPMPARPRAEVLRMDPSRRRGLS
ncbi:MAG TPA: DUF3135 domain-containing protein [Gammaproteobacteria bacterium]|nr:DUF3135 domain-containing protein [Gammaproteobacteria bacterium]